MSRPAARKPASSADVMGGFALRQSARRSKSKRGVTIGPTLRTMGLSAFLLGCYVLLRLGASAFGLGSP